MVMATSASFWKKYGPMIPPDQNPHQTVTFSGCVWSWCISRELISSQIRQFCLFIYPFIQNWASSKDDFFGEIWVNFQLLQNPIREHTALSMVVYLKFLGQLNFIGTHLCRPKSQRKIRQIEVAERPSSCERREINCLGFSRTFSRTAAMFSTDLTFRRRIGIGWLFIEPIDSNLATKRRIVDSAGRLCKDKIT